MGQMKSSGHHWLPPPQTEWRGGATKGQAHGRVGSVGYHPSRLSPLAPALNRLRKFLYVLTRLRGALRSNQPAPESYGHQHLKGSKKPGESAPFAKNAAVNHTGIVKYAKICTLSAQTCESWQPSENMQTVTNTVVVLGSQTHLLRLDRTRQHEAIGCPLLNSPAAGGLSDCELSMRENLRVVGISRYESAFVC